MKSKFWYLSAIFAFAFALTGCDKKAELGSTKPVSPNLSSSEPATDKWLGQWNGPEGTFLRLAGGKGSYDITIQNLDGPTTYKGSAVGDQVQFERNGMKESIHASNGAETGMKWLSEKSNCLTIHTGEGYCRD